MSKVQQYSWGSLITTGLVYLYFQMRMLDGWRVVEQSANLLFWTYITVIVLAIVAEGILSGFVFARNKGEVDMDERDKSIDARAEANAGIFLAIGLNIIILHAIASQAFPGKTFIGLSENLYLETPAQILFVLMSVLFISHWVKLITSLYLYSK